MHLDIAHRIDLRELLAQGFGVFRFCPVSVVNGDQHIIIRDDLVHQLKRRFFNAQAVHCDFAVAQTDDAAFLDVQLLHVRITHGVGDRAGAHALSSLIHAAFIILRRKIRLKRHDSGQTHRHVFRRQDHDVLVRQQGNLLSRQDHIAVIGQHKDGFGVNAFHCLGKVLNAGVHGLPAFNDRVNAQILENAGKTGSQRDRHHAEILGLGLRALLGLLGVIITALLDHVIDLDARQLAQHQPVLEGFARIVRVNMHLEHGVIAHHQHAVTDAAQLAAEGVNFRICQRVIGILDKILRAVGKLDLFQALVVVREHFLMRSVL